MKTQYRDEIATRLQKQMHSTVRESDESAVPISPNRFQIPFRTVLRFVIFGLSVVTIGIFGCSRWKDRQTTQKGRNHFELTAPELPVDAVEMEMIIARINPEDAETEERVWNELDQQAIDIGIRKRLAANGIRCGVSSAHLPLSLQQIVQHHTEDRAIESKDAETLVSGEVFEQTMQLRAGQASHIIMSAIIPRLTWIVDEDGYLYGDEHFDARCRFTLKTRPVKNNRVGIELTPEIIFGDTHQRIGVGNSALVYEMAQDRTIFNELAIRAELGAGHWLVIGNTPSASGIGETFLSEAEEDGGRRKLVMLRLTELGSEDISAEAIAPIATPTD